MKKLSVVSMFVLVMSTLFLISTYASARDLAVEFSYTPAEPVQEAVSYNIYADGVLVCSPTVGVDPGMLFCDANELVSKSYDWVMTAVFANGEESPNSPSFPFTIPLKDPNSPIILTIRMK